jgi:quercetin dioxygenase-like cupin family protein
MTTPEITNAIATHVRKGQGRVLHAFGDELVFKLTAEETGGSLTLWENITPPGGGPPAHYHQDEDELFIVQEGQMRFFIDGEWQDAGPGSVVFAPRNGVHMFRNVGTTPSRMLTLAQPSGFETFFARCAEEFKRPGGPDMDRITAISAAHGIYYVTETTPATTAVCE